MAGTLSPAGRPVDRGGPVDRAGRGGWVRRAGPVGRWLTEPVPLGRAAAFRMLVYLFVAADLVVFTPWVRTHAAIPGELYQPLLIGRLLPLPVPGPALVHTVFWALLVLAPAAATGRAPRLLGWAVFALYLEWMIIAMSYGKVDHDRFALLVALAVLPTVARARHGDPTRSEAAGWALRVTQIAVVSTYFLAGWAKVRFGGWDWATGSVLARAILRRGTDFGDLIAPIPYLLVAAQIGILAFELASPAIFLTRGRWRYAAIGYFYAFHALTFAMITISFAPHLVAMASFLPLERVRPVVWARRAIARRHPAAFGGRQRAGGGPARHPVAVSGHPAIDRPRHGQAGAGAEEPPEAAPAPRRATQQRGDGRGPGENRRAPVPVGGDPLHGLVTLGGRQAERAEIDELPGPNPRRSRDAAFDEPRARAAERAVAVVDELGSRHTSMVHGLARSLDADGGEASHILGRAGPEWRRLTRRW